MFGRSSATFDRYVEKATSQLLLEPDWDSILCICDSIRQGDVIPKNAVLSIRKKIANENPNVTMFALQVLESVVKNCGSSIHMEVASKEFMEFMKDLIKTRSDPTKEKILELIQCWSHAFRNEPSYKAVQDTYHLMKMEGYTFPTMKEADAMFVAEKAPEWKDGEVCHRCRVQFGMVQRKSLDKPAAASRCRLFKGHQERLKHHCRNCGQVFCGKCSSKNSIIPRFGIEREVRVCDACFETLNKAAASKKAGSEDDLPPEYLASPLSQQPQVPSHTSPRRAPKLPPSRSEAEIQEEEELQLAIALSKSEAETKDKDRGRLTSNFTSYGSSTTTSADAPASVAPAQVTAPMFDTSDMDPELARYLNRNYWEQKQAGTTDEKSSAPSMMPSAPTAVSEAKTSAVTTKVSEKYQNGEVDDEEQFLNALRSSIEIFVNRMKSNSARGRSIANDSSVQTLFMTLNSMHPQLLTYMAKQDEQRTHYEGLQDKLAQIRDAREALDALRDEHREKRRLEQEELERQRQIQMAHKLEIMRQKKQEYLEYQRQLALQRMQEQERELHMRMEQQKQMQQMRSMQAYTGQAYPQAYPQMPQQMPPPQMYGPPGTTFSPAGSVEGSPLHQAPGANQPPMNNAPYVPQQPMGAAPPGMGPPPMGAQQLPGIPYSMPPPAPGAPAPTTGYQPPPPPGGYQPPSSSYQGAPYQQPPTSTPQMPPGGNGQQPPAQAYTAPAMDYSFNMQNVANALPGQPPQQPQQQQQPPQQQPPQQQPQQQYMPGAPAQPPPPGQFPQGQMPPPPEQQMQQPPPQMAPQAEAQLISFD